MGWLLAGVYGQRRQFVRQAKSAGRAVYFELLLNRMHVIVARDYGSFLPLSWTTFERLLPELATWQPSESLRTIVAAYMGHAGYEQRSTERGAPAELRRRALHGIEATHRSALDTLRSTLFSAREIAALSGLGGRYAIRVPASTFDATVVRT